jgi:hypothetical protein
MQDYKPPPKPKSKGLWPVYGLLMAVALGIISYFIAPTVQRMVIQITRGGFTGQELPPDQMRLFFTGLVFLVLGSIAALIVAMARPKPKRKVMDADLVKQKDAMRLEEKRRRARKAVIEHEMKKRNKRLE